jgi:hypothetical protein
MDHVLHHSTLPLDGRDLSALRNKVCKDDKKTGQGTCKPPTGPPIGRGHKVTRRAAHIEQGHAQGGAINSCPAIDSVNADPCGYSGNSCP